MKVNWIVLITFLLLLPFIAIFTVFGFIYGILAIGFNKGKELSNDFAEAEIIKWTNKRKNEYQLHL